MLHAEMQLTSALPKMASAAHDRKLKEGFEKHLVQTQTHVDRLKMIFDLLGEPAKPKPCKAMMGLIEEGQETIEEGSSKSPLAADLALVASAQRVEHYEIAGYGNVRCLATQIGEREVANLLSYTLGEEESTDYLLTEMSKPLLQQATLQDYGSNGEETKKKAPVVAKAKS